MMGGWCLALVAPFFHPGLLPAMEEEEVYACIHTCMYACVQNLHIYSFFSSYSGAHKRGEGRGGEVASLTD